MCEVDDYCVHVTSGVMAAMNKQLNVRFSSLNSVNILSIFIENSGPCSVGIESTIIDVAHDHNSPCYSKKAPADSDSLSACAIED